jgi:UDP-N-acetylmuramoyl-L-alanyl-D-glutamate--2,6-diaminopimelate ligase
MPRIFTQLKIVLSKITPSFLLSTYYFLLAFVAALWYGFPSRRMTIIGVTGTKGKTTTCNLIAHILESVGHTVGMATTVNFRIGKRIWTNNTKQTMLGRFGLQKLLREMVDEGCTHAVIETSSEGIIQYRHRFIDYRVAVLTNLSPEHIERHGSFEAYRDAKVKLFAHVARKKDGIGIYNLDDPSVEYFLKPKVTEKIGYSQATRDMRYATCDTVIEATDVSYSSTGTTFTIHHSLFTIPLLGQGNLYNALAAIGVARALGVSDEHIAQALQSAPQVPGRMEIVRGKGFTIIIDYAHEPKSLEEVYKTAQLFKPKRMIGILGSQGGGRDTWKRAAMGKIAARYLNTIILTNEDPYDEEPSRILEDVRAGIFNFPAEGGSRQAGQFSISKNLFEIIDRREAIRKAISLAESGDVVLLTGKGGEVWMCVEGGRKVAWNEKGIVEEILGR